MKTQEQQKSELCDRMMYVLRNNLVSETLMGFVSEYDQITQQKPLSQDPYIDEIFSGRTCGVIRSHLKSKIAYDDDYFKNHEKIKNIRLSDLPNIRYISQARGFGKMMRKEFFDIMSNYKMLDKV